MNRRQQERVEDLGRAFTEAIADLVNDGDLREDIGMLVAEEAIPAGARPSGAYPALAPHTINIQQVHNGFIVSAGCQTFVFEKIETASRYMTLYFQDPEGTEKKHRDGTLFSK
jgi:hypothetical protein